METVLRVVVIYFFLLFGMRVIGKREFGQLAPHEFVILLLIPEMITSALNKEDTSLTNALAGTATILCLVFITSVLTHRFRAVEHIVADSSTVLVHDGKLMEDALDRERVTPEEILHEALKSGVGEFSHIQWAILLPDGKIAIVSGEEPARRQPEKVGKH